MDAFRARASLICTLSFTVYFVTILLCAYSISYNYSQEPEESQELMFIRVNHDYCTYTCALSHSCRDARNMARDVHNAILQIVEQHGSKSSDEAAEYVKKLQKRGRYLQDVWS